MKRQNLFTPHKLSYVQGKKPDVPCILCAVRDGDERVRNLEVYRGKMSIITLNLYPYSPGHLMIFPKRHIKDIRQLNKEEIDEIHHFLHLSLDILDRIYSPHGYNIGYNMGKASGASMEHLHLHIVPRYHNEIGFLDVINGTRVIVEDPLKTKARLIEAFKKDGGSFRASNHP
jgi:ATP adenylyltransferase